MGHLDTTKDVAAGLTRVKVTGEIEAHEILDWFKNDYTVDITKLVLWDFTEAIVSSISTETLRAYAAEARQRGEGRRGGKTALVFAREADFGIGRLYEALAEMEKVPVTVKSFRSLKKAREWLGLED